MSWNYYRSTDASAPTLTGTTGSLISLLDACLVTGYGAKPAAGWTKAYTGTNLAAYRMGSGLTQYYLRVDDNAPGAGGAREARLIGYETMSDVNTGTLPFPSTGQQYFRKSATLDGTARPWFLVADDRTFIMTQSFDSSASSYSGTYFGQIYSYVPNDPYGVALVARNVENLTTYASNSEALGYISASTATSTQYGHLLARDTTTLLTAIGFERVGGIGPVPNSAPVGNIGYPNLADGSLLLVPQYVRYSESSVPLIRGRMRGLWICFHNNFGSFSNPGDTFSGTGDLAGKSFVFAGYASHTNQINAGFYILETSNTVPAN